MQLTPRVQALIFALVTVLTFDLERAGEIIRP